MKSIISIIILILALSLSLKATNLTDSVVVTFDAYLEMVKMNHPL